VKEEMARNGEEQRGTRQGQRGREDMISAPSPEQLRIETAEVEYGTGLRWVGNASSQMSMNGSIALATPRDVETRLGTI
jgi:hypothetical protein